MSAQYTLFDLNETIGNAKRYSLVNHGPVAYLSTSEECAQYIVKACNAFPHLVDALQRASSRLSETATDGDEKQDALQIIQDVLDSVGGTSGN